MTNKLDALFGHNERQRLLIATLEVSSQCLSRLQLMTAFVSLGKDPQRSIVSHRSSEFSRNPASTPRAVLCCLHVQDAMLECDACRESTSTYSAPFLQKLILHYQLKYVVTMALIGIRSTRF